jgi:hypothetical protein
MTYTFHVDAVFAFDIKAESGQQALETAGRLIESDLDEDALRCVKDPYLQIKGAVKLVESYCFECQTRNSCVCKKGVL